MIGKRGAEEREGECYRQFQTNKLFIKISCHVITADVRKRVREIHPSCLYVLRIQAATVWGWEWQGRDSLGNGLLCAAYFYSCALLLQPRSHLLLPLKSKESPKLLFPCRESSCLKTCWFQTLFQSSVLNTMDLSQAQHICKWHKTGSRPVQVARLANSA